MLVHKYQSFQCDIHGVASSTSNEDRLNRVRVVSAYVTLLLSGMDPILASSILSFCLKNIPLKPFQAITLTVRMILVPLAMCRTLISHGAVH